ncbi:MAG: hypothetical protein H7222_10000 [Methylotenera sp.]|nr:hypothetical protein [Oligoflexia bacterium]
MMKAKVQVVLLISAVLFGGVLTTRVQASDVPQPVTLAELAGTWKTPCMTAGAMSEISQLDFTARGEVTDKASVFADFECGSSYYAKIAQFYFSINADQVSATACATGDCVRAN